MENASTKVQFVIAIDGPAGSGKSTVARRIAAALGFTLLDTGALYRSLAFVARERGVAWDDDRALAELALHLVITFSLKEEVNHVFVNRREVTGEIRTQEISLGASQVSALAAVRQALLGLQRRVAEQGPVVAEGRDMGTVVFPNANLKIFLNADPLERAKRRHRELVAAKHQVALEQVLEEQNRRDEADASRDVAPLKPAHDAHIIDTTSLTIDEVVEEIIKKVQYP